MNFRFLGSIALIAAAAGLGVHLLHAYQMRESADMFRERAERHLAAGEREQAVRYLRQYIGFVPEDLDGLVLLGTTLEEIATTRRQWLDVYLAYSRVLGIDEDHGDIARRFVKAAMRVGRYNEARRRLHRLLKSSPNDSQLRLLLAICWESDRNEARAKSAYRAAIQHDPTRIDAYTGLARLLRRSGSTIQQADAVMDELVTNNPQSCEAFLARASYQRAYGSLEEALAAAKKAEQLAPTDPEALLAVVQLITARSASSPEELDAARQRLQRGIKQNAADSRFYLALWQVESRADRPERAIDALRRGRHALPQDVELICSIADLLITQQKLAEARKEIDQLRKLDASHRFVDYFDARILMRQGDVIRAAKLLQSVLPKSQDRPLLLKLAGLNLSVCYRRLGDFEQQLATCRAVLDTDPLALEARLGEAEALAALGRTNEALAKYHPALLAVPGVPLQVAKLLFQQTVRKPSRERNWEPFRAALELAKEQDAETVDIPVLEAEFLKTAGQPDRAQAVLEEQRETFPDSLPLRIALATLAASRGDTNEAAGILAAAEEDLGDSAELRLARAASSRYLDDGEAKRVLSELASDRDGFTAEESARLLEGLAAVHFERGDWPEAQAIWTEVAQLRPQHLLAQFRLFNLALQLDDEDAAKGALGRLRRIEGADGPHVLLAQATQLIRQAADGKLKVVEQARRLLSRVKSQRPRWVLIPLSRARIEELGGARSRAGEYYAEAIKLGNRDPQVFRRAIELLSESHQAGEVQLIIDLVENDTPPRDRKELQKIAAEVAARGEAPSQIEDLVNRAVPPDSADWADQLWRGTLLATAGAADESEQALRKAVALAPGEPAALVALVRFLARSEKDEEAAEVVRTAEKHLDAGDAPLALAQCYEAVNRLDVAEERYLQALSSRRSDAATVRSVAEFYLRTNQQEKAEPLLHRLTDPDQQRSRETVLWSRRALATVLASKNYAGFREALRLLDQNIAQARDKAVEERVKIGLLALQPQHRHLREAIRRLEGLTRRTNPSNAERRLLARLCDTVGETSKAERHWAALSSDRSVEPAYLGEYVARLIDRNQLDQAATWLERLEARVPNTSGTIELRVRLLAKKRLIDQATNLVNSFVDADEQSTEAHVARSGQAARLLANLSLAGTEEDRKKLAQEAERHYRRFVASKPEATLELATFLGRLGRTEEGLDFCESVLKAKSRPALEVTAAGIVVLRRSRYEKQQARRVETWLEAALEGDPDSIEASKQLADLREFEGRWEDAIGIYRKVLKADPRDFVALNNLAWLLSVHRGDHSEAGRSIAESIEIAGPLPILLDTRGLISLHAGDVAAAVKDFEEVVLHDPSAANRLHLAMAYWQADNLPAARFHLRKALDEKLQIDQVHPLEQDAFRTLTKALKLTDDLAESGSQD